MVGQKIKVINKSGLHLRPAGNLCKIASNCKSSISFIKGDKRVNPKSILLLISASIKCGEEIIVECDGETEVEDLQTILDAISSGLGE